MADIDKSGLNNEVVASTEDFEKDLKLNTSAFEVLERDFEEVRSSYLHSTQCIILLTIIYIILGYRRTFR